MILNKLEQVDASLILLLQQKEFNNKEIASLLEDRKKYLEWITKSKEKPKETQWNKAKSRAEKIIALLHVQRERSLTKISSLVKGRQSVNAYKKMNDRGI